MQEFIAKYKDEIQGTLSGIDRLVFWRSVAQIRLLPAGSQSYDYRVLLLWSNISFTNTSCTRTTLSQVKAVSERIKEASLAPFRDSGLPVIHLRSPPN